MQEAITLLTFSAGLLISLFLKISTFYALLFGYVVFFLYGLKKGHTAGAILRMSLKGIRTVKNILIVFVLIGMLTAVWRACGTVAIIVAYASRVIVPSFFVLIAFLLCSLMSMLFGTSFGTAATMGVICMTISQPMGISTVVMGGAILSGCYFGDRCSPMSTSALLISELTKTDLFSNIKRMLREQILPVILTGLIYLLLGLSATGTAAGDSIYSLFEKGFRLHWSTLLPALLILFLSLLKMKVKRIMLASILMGAALCLLVQGMDVVSLIKTLVMGYRSSTPEIALMLDGGGILSMLNVAAIICISSTYAGIFEGTGLLIGLQRTIEAASLRITPFGGALVTSIATAIVACNQTLTIMLTYQLCKKIIPKPEEMASSLSYSALLIAPMVPWSIAAMAPLSSVNAPESSILFACYLYLLPLWKLALVLKNPKPLTPSAKE